jgi:lipid II isoglutaminyl synthase (glutamine-hydrolysing)
LIGNIVIERNGVQLVGYENHSGQTDVDDGAEVFGSVMKGAGNSKNSGTEGCVVGSVFGTYMHGPLLSKNPEFADVLILRMLKKYNVTELTKLDDTTELRAHKNATQRPR